MSGKLSCIVVDDEPVALKIVTSLVEKTDFLNLVGSYQNSVEGANAIGQLQPDILFLDIQMPEVSGFDIIKSLDKRPEIILITSKKEYAIDAFNFKITDYLLKPVKNYSRFLQAAQRAKENIESINNENPKDESIFLRIDSLLKKVEFKDILFVEAFGDYIKVHTKEKVHMVYSKLKAIEKELSANEFIRVHRSYIVRIDKIDNIDTSNLQIDEKIVPISTRHKAALLDSIKTL